MSTEDKGTRGRDAPLNVTPTPTIVHMVLQDTHSVYIVVQICNVAQSFENKHNLTTWYITRHMPNTQQNTVCGYLTECSGTNMQAREF